MLVLGLLPGCGSDDASDEASGPSTRPNILFLTVDTLRPDHMEIYGYDRETMPAIAEFATTGVTFDNAVVPRGSTRPSYASMLSGLYPHHHGVRWNRIVVHDDVVMLPELLREHGYHTAAFVSNFVLVGELSGMSQGFDLYDDLMRDREGSRLNYQRKAAGTLQAMNQWLASEPPEPFFLFVNFIDPHGPYSPPEKYREMYKTDRRRELSLDKIPPYQVYGDSLNYFDYIDRYDAEIRYVDDAIAAFIERLQASGHWDDALVVFVADHGEALGEHDQFFGHHAYLWEETTRVPMVIRLPAQMEDPGLPRRMKTVVSVMDLTPTVLDLLDIEAPHPLNGRSFLPVLEGQEDLQRTAFMEFPARKKQHPEMYAVRGVETKLVRLVDPETGRMTVEGISDLTEDPFEENLLPVDPSNAEHRRLQTELDSILVELQDFALPFAVTEYVMPLEERSDFLQGRSKDTVLRNMSPEQMERLRSLGYIQ